MISSVSLACCQIDIYNVMTLYLHVLVSTITVTVDGLTVAIAASILKSNACTLSHLPVSVTPQPAAAEQEICQRLGQALSELLNKRLKTSKLNFYRWFIMSLNQIIDRENSRVPSQFSRYGPYGPYLYSRSVRVTHRVVFPWRGCRMTAVARQEIVGREQSSMPRVKDGVWALPSALHHCSSLAMIHPILRCPQILW